MAQRHVKGRKELPIDSREIVNFLIRYASKFVTDVNNRVIYGDGTLGSTLEQLLSFHFGKNDKQPTDYEKFRDLLNIQEKDIASLSWSTLY